MKVTFP